MFPPVYFATNYFAARFFSPDSGPISLIETTRQSANILVVGQMMTR